MRTRPFGSTPLVVSEIGFGCARLGGLVTRNQGRGESAEDLLLQAFDAGINFFDTADMYTQGESETLIGRAFRSRRDKVVIASKGGYCLPGQRKLLARVKPLLRPLVQALGVRRSSLPAAVTGSLSQNFSPDYLIKAAEASLRRLQTDHIDLYQLHSPPREVIESGEFLEPLEALRKQGKIRWFGVAADSVEDARLCLKYSELASVMAPIGLLDLEALDGFLAQAEEKGLAVIARGCFGGGLLKPDIAEAELQALTPKWSRILAYRERAAALRRSVLECALRFPLRLKPVAVTLAGMRTGAHLRENLTLLDSPSLSDEAMAILADGRDLAGLLN